MTTETTQEAAPLISARRDDVAMLLTVCDLYAPHEIGTGKLSADIAPVAARVREAVERGGDNELVMLREGGRELGRITARLYRTMRAAVIEMHLNGSHAGMQWVLNSIEPTVPGDDDPLAWDGVESAQAWFDRVEAADRAASEAAA